LTFAAVWGGGTYLASTGGTLGGVQTEWLIVAIVLLVIVGGSQIPKLARNLGKAQNEFKKGLSEGQADSENDKA
jgi:sec-independent protein translocase protein TatA